MSALESGLRYLKVGGRCQNGGGLFGENQKCWEGEQKKEGTDGRGGGGFEEQKVFAAVGTGIYNTRFCSKWCTTEKWDGKTGRVIFAVLVLLQKKRRNPNKTKNRGSVREINAVLYVFEKKKTS